MTDIPTTSPSEAAATSGWIGPPAAAPRTPHVRKSCRRCHANFTNGGYGAQCTEDPRYCRDCYQWLRQWGPPGWWE